jgi:6-pyruvoyltetrahydropterin/6-carboxytetrahydropterin synthase
MTSQSGLHGIYRIAKSFSFAASHKLEGLGEGHKCSRLHGHSYEVTLEIAGKLNAVGFVVDFADLSWLDEVLRDRLDHRHLNDVLDVNPTSENIAGWLSALVMRWIDAHPDRSNLTAYGIKVQESPRTSATTWVDLA